MIQVLLAVSLSQQIQQPAHGVADRIATVDVSELDAKYRRLAEAGLFEPELKPLRGVRPPLAPAKERPRPGALLRLPAPLPEATRSLAPQRSAVSPDTPRTLSGFNGLDDDLTSTPPDSHGAVGPRHVMTALNSEVLIQDRQGRALSRVIIEDFWRPTGTITSAFDPRVFYDRARDRWVFCTLAEPQSTNSLLLMGVSQTGDPTGRWSLYRIPGEFNGAWTDYPTMALSGPWVIVTTNRFSLTSDRFTQAGIFVFTKDDLYNGRGTFRTFTDVIASAPVQDDTRTDRVALIASANGPRGFIRVSEIRGAPGDETFVANVTGFTIADTWAFTPPDQNFAPQLDSTARLDLGDDRMQQCVMRGTTIWCAHNVFLPVATPTRGAVQWLEIAVNASGYGLTRTGRIEDPNVSFAYPGIAVNRNNDVLIGYTRFSDRQFPSANFSFRAGTDPPGQFQADTVFKQGESAYRSRTSRNRWGDYSVAIVDPVDDLGLWTIQEYAASPVSSGAPTRWGTWWANVTPLPAGTQPCAFTLSGTTFNVSGNGGPVSINVRARAECRWMAAPNAPWLTITSGAPGAGDGTIALTAAANRSASERRATVTIAGSDVTVVQAAGADAAELFVASVTVPSSVTLGRAFSAAALVRNQGARAVTSFSIGFYVSARAQITANDTFTGFSCTIANGLQPGQSVNCGGNIELPISLAPGQYFIGAIADAQNRLQLPFRDNAARAADTVTSVSLPPDGPVFTSRSVTHAASNAVGVVSPGQVIVIYGTRMGPATLQSARVENNRLVSNLANTEVRFDGVAAPLVYVSAGQLAAIAPLGLANRQTTRMQIVSSGLPSEVVTVNVTPLAPAFFTTDFSGRGGVAALNQDSSVNTATNAAARGQVVQLFATGFGVLDPVVPDGTVIGPPLPRLPTNVTMRIGGQNARVLYAGPAPGLAAGVVQINAEVPANSSTGAVPLEVQAGSVSGPPGTTIFVR